MRKRLTALILIAALSLCGCGANQSNQKQTTENTEAQTEEITEEKSKNDNDKEDKTEDTKDATVEEVDVSDSDDDTVEEPTEEYYNLIDEGYQFTRSTQFTGTCWLNAGIASMECGYNMDTGKTIELSLNHILDYLYGNDKEEGFFLEPGKVDKRNHGGWTWIITEGMSNGFEGATLTRAVILKDSNKKTIKNAVKEYGAVVVSILDRDEPKKKDGDDIAYNTTSSEDPDHDVCVIGWDDNYSKDKFKETPKEDGAWIVYNSLLGDAGYYYISYETPLYDPIPLSVTDEYSKVATYDGGNEMDRNITTGKKTKVANRYNEPGTLLAVGTYSEVENQNITIEIYDKDFKNVLLTQDAVLDYHGYHTIKLDKPLDVTEYAIAITYEGGAPVEGETTECGDFMYYTVSSKENQSFVWLDDKWVDMHDKDIKSRLSLDFEPNNCCIKGLYK